MSLEEAVQIAEQDYILIPKVKSPETINGNVVLDVTTALICKEFGFTLEEIKSRSRAGYLPRARYRIFYITKKIFPNMGIRAMGRKFNLSENNAHSNVIHGMKQMEGEIRMMPKIKEELEYLEKRVREELAK